MSEAWVQIAVGVGAVVLGVLGPRVMTALDADTGGLESWNDECDLRTRYRRVNGMFLIAGGVGIILFGASHLVESTPLPIAGGILALLGIGGFLLRLSLAR